MEIFSFFLGTVFVYSQSPYPLICIVLILFLKGSRWIILWFLAACILSFLHNLWSNDSGMPPVNLIPKAELVGVISSMPVITDTRTQFQFNIERLNEKPVKAQILLSCYQECPMFKAGETWRLHAKLKRPQNLGNPGSKDYRQALEAKHIHWTGYLKRGSSVLLKPPPATDLLVIRERMAKKLEALISQPEILGVAEALTLGVTTHIDSSLWDLFRRTGTTHLMVISGAHIMLVAGLVYWLMQRLWSCSSYLCLTYSSLQMAGIVSILAALGYSLLAGFGVPAQRSLISCLFVMLPYFINQRFSVWQGWRYAILLVLIYEPHAVLQPGFYLSFLAVAILISMNRRLSVGGFKRTLGLQLACLIGLLPFTLFWFSYGAMNGFVANLLAIPMVGYILVPLSLVTLFIVQLFSVPWLTQPLEWSTNVLLYYLRWINDFDTFNLTFSFNSILPILSITLSLMICVFCPIKSYRSALFVLSIAPFFPKYPVVKEGEAQVNILDVGQGLAIAIHTAHHLLIYDTGAKFFQGSDMATMVIIPYLKTRGISQIDTIVISHPDLDHRGGLESLQASYPVRKLLVDRPNYYQKAQGCHDYPDWEWDGIAFHFMPLHFDSRDKNNSSCVLQVTRGDKQLLLVGDVEKLAENYLVENYKNQLKSTYLVVAHHGSKTSSTPAFIEQVNPEFAIISAGFDNRYHFPHQKTLETLNNYQVKALNTIECGMVSIALNASNMKDPFCYKRV